MKPRIKKTGSGIEILFINISDSVNVTAMVVFAVGSRHEKDNHQGIAHFVEHTIFNGTTIRPTSKDIGMDLELLGGDTNAFTSYEYTAYYIKIPKINFVGGIEILADMIKNPLFSKKEVEKEKGVIIEEIKMYEDVPREKLRRMYNKSLFEDNELGRDIAGTIESVNNINREDLLSFSQEHYRTNKMLVILSGSFEEEIAYSTIEKNFTNFKKGEPANIITPKRRNLQGDIELIDQKSEQTHVMLGGFSYNRGFEGKYALKVGNAILSYGLGSMLFQKLREELGVAYYVFASTSEFSDIGKYAVNMGVNKEKVEESVSAVLECLKDLKTGNFDNRDFERAKNYLLGYYTTQLEATDDIAQWYGMKYLFSRELEDIGSILKKIQTVTKEEVVKTWSNILKEENIRLSALGEFNKELKFELSI